MKIYAKTSHERRQAMITCSHCGKEDAYRGISSCCPYCGTPFSITEEDKNRRLQAICAPRAKKNASYAENCRILADLGISEGIRRCGTLLEAAGQADDAADIYITHADTDAYASYRLAWLLRETDKKQSFFRLRYAAVFGCPESYEPLANAYAKKGHRARVIQFLRMASDGGSRKASLALARLFLEETSDEKSESAKGMARYFLNRTPLPMLFAPRLYKQLKSCPATEPQPIPKDALIPLFYELAQEARRTENTGAHLRICEELFALGRADMQETLALLLLNGEGCTADIDRALALLCDLSERGDTSACIRLGDLYQKGEQVQKDHSLAMTYYQRAAEFGDGRGYERIGDYYCDGEERPLIPKAIEQYDKGAALGCSEAARKSHDLKTQREAYYNRAVQECEHAPLDAYRHFVTAADMGYLPAQVRIGDCYLRGIGVPADRRRAFLWYSFAAEHGCEEAYYPLGLCHARGVGTPFSFPLAMTYLRKADALGYEGAGKEARRLLENKRKKKERALRATVCELLYQGKGAQAAPLAEFSAELGNGKALYTLAAMYEYGLGVTIDVQRAADLYARAEAAHFSDERAAYKRILLRQANRPGKPM